tara:strand:- start:80 stop:742 length:663 start_codon:yes stop_codon:yes gene_type:complete
MNIGKREFPDIGLIAFDLESSHTAYGGAVSIKNNTYKFDEVDFKKGDVFVDLGANIGLVSMYVASHFSAEVHAFECCPTNFRLLNLNSFANNVRIITNSFGVSDETKVAQMNIDTTNTGGTSLYATEEGESRIRESAYLLDFEVAMEPFKKIKYLKMDIEGAEFAIFQKLIKNKSPFFEKVEFFHLEVHNQYLINNFEERESEIINYLDTFPNLKSFILR